MRGVSAKLPNLAKGVVQPAEHCIQGVRQLVEFVASAAFVEPLVEPSGTNALCRLAHLRYRGQGAMRQKPATATGQDQRDGKHESQDAQKVSPGFVKTL